MKNPPSCAMSPAKIARINRNKYGTDRAIQMMHRHMKYADPYDKAFYQAVIDELRPRRNPGVLRPKRGFWKELGVKREGLKKVQAELWETKGIWKTIDELEQFVLENQTRLLQSMIRIVK